MMEISDDERLSPSLALSTSSLSTFSRSQSPLHIHPAQKHVDDLARARGERVEKEEEKRECKCNCKNSKCLKMYCDCFTNRGFCKGCNCVNCHNLPEYMDEVEKAVKVCLERNSRAFQSKVQQGGEQKKGHVSGCHCRKSNCLKKYCECFQARVPCGDKCHCKDCKNTNAAASYGSDGMGVTIGNMMDDDDSASVLLMLPNAYPTQRPILPPSSIGSFGIGTGVGTGGGDGGGGIKLFTKSRTQAEANLRRGIEERERERERAGVPSANGVPSSLPPAPSHPSSSQSQGHYPSFASTPSSSLPPHFRSRYSANGSVPMAHSTGPGYQQTSVPIYSSHPHLFSSSPLPSMSTSPYASLGSRSIPFGSSQIHSSVTPHPYLSNASGMGSSLQPFAFRNRSEPLNPSDTMNRYSAYLAARGAQSVPQGPQPNAHPYISNYGYNVTPRFYNPNFRSATTTSSSSSSVSSGEFDREREKEGEREREREKERERAGELVIPPESFRALAGLCEKLISSSAKEGEWGRERKRMSSEMVAEEREEEDGREEERAGEVLGELSTFLKKSISLSREGGRTQIQLRMPHNVTPPPPSSFAPHPHPHSPSSPFFSSLHQPNSSSNYPNMFPSASSLPPIDPTYVRSMSPASSIPRYSPYQSPSTTNRDFERERERSVGWGQDVRNSPNSEVFSKVESRRDSLDMDMLCNRENENLHPELPSREDM